MLARTSNSTKRGMPVTAPRKLEFSVGNEACQTLSHDLRSDTTADVLELLDRLLLSEVAKGDGELTGPHATELGAVERNTGLYQ